MLSFMQAYREHTYALLRIVTGFLFFWHGSQKLLGYPPSEHQASGYILWIAGPIEFFGGILILIGLFTRPVAFLCAGFAAAAYWIGHGTQAFLPIVNRGELAALYCFVFLYMAARGAGIWSVDAARGRPD